MGRKRMIFGSEVVIAIIIAIATLLVLKESSSFFDQSLWEPCPPKIRMVKLIDGSTARSNLMRRKVNGRWEYRKRTDHEMGQTAANLELP
jgi:hypothetical protein